MIRDADDWNALRSEYWIEQTDPASVNSFTTVDLQTSFVALFGVVLPRGLVMDPVRDTLSEQRLSLTARIIDESETRQRRQYRSSESADDDGWYVANLIREYRRDGAVPQTLAVTLQQQTATTPGEEP